MATRSEPTLRQVYGEDSFDRFCDDLCEEVLSYLTLEDRFRCECVSKQWQRLVYKTQTVFTYDRKLLKVESFKRILKKCQNISRIGQLSVSFNDNSMFELITKHCNHLNHIYILFYALSVDTIAKFFAKFAKSLQSIEGNSWHIDTDVWKCVNNCLTLCTNVTKLKIYDNSMSTVPTFDVLFRRLNSFWFKYTNEDTKRFEIFVTRYGKTMKSINVDIDEKCNEKSIDILMTGLSQMPQLIDLKIYASDMESTVNDSRLKQIGVNCGQLKSLSLDGRMYSCELMSQLMQTINANFKQLKRLQVSGIRAEQFAFTSESLSGCKRLTHFTLNLLRKSVINVEDFTRDIDQHLPRIQYIKIRATDITDSVLNSLSKLKKIQYICFDGCKVQFTEQAIHNLIANCPKIIRFFADKKYV